MKLNRNERMLLIQCLKESADADLNMEDIELESEDMDEVRANAKAKYELIDKLGHAIGYNKEADNA